MDYIIREMRSEEYILLSDFCTKRFIFQKELNRHLNQ